MSTPSHTVGSTIQVGAGRYDLMERLGAGAFGEVYLAEDLDEGDHVAVKLFGAGTTLDDALLEARLQRRLSTHPNVVGLRNVDVRSGGGPIIVTEYWPRGSVEGLIGKGGKADLPDALRWTRNTSDALSHAHALGVFHRDVKPSNLLVDSSGAAGLTDFGVSEDTVNGLGSTLTYTPLIAPELQTSGSSEMTEVWMLGCLLYRLICGEYPYPAGAAGLPVGASVRPQDEEPQLPARIVRLIQRALDPDPARRHQSVGEFRTELLRCSAVATFRPGATSPPVIESWEATTRAGRVVVELQAVPRGRFRARMRIDRGSGLRRADLAPERTSVSMARRDCRTLMSRVVEGRAAAR